MNEKMVKKQTYDNLDHEGMVVILQKAGLRMTPRRNAILKVLENHSEPLSVEEIVKASNVRMDIVTTYRTLEAFAKTGVVRRVTLSPDKSHYELDRGHHHHIVCTECGDTEDVTECDLGGAVKHITRGSSKFKTILDHSLEFFGVCKKCSK
jgi:Fur family ferric uptake transcriptional regulator